MQIRCQHCHRPYALSHDAIQAALEHVRAEDLSHYNAPCPHCRRVNRVSRQELERAVPERDRAPEEIKRNDADT